MNKTFDFWMDVSPGDVDWAARILISHGSQGAVESASAKGKIRVLGSFPVGRLRKIQEALRQLFRAAVATGEIQELPVVGAAPTPEVDWRGILRFHHRPFELGGIYFRSPWVESRGGLEIVLEPGLAFGMGNHETTQLCLRALHGEFKASPYSIRRLFDVGTGSGILALFALRLWEQLEAVGCDVDADAIAAAREAAGENGLTQRLTLFQGRPASYPGRFDLVVANLQWRIFQVEMEALASKLDVGGLLLCSGLLLDQAERLEDLGRSRGLSFVGQVSGKEWCLLRFRCMERA